MPRLCFGLGRGLRPGPVSYGGPAPAAYVAGHAPWKFCCDTVSGVAKSCFLKGIKTQRLGM